MYTIIESEEWDPRGDDSLKLLWGDNRSPDRWAVCYAGEGSGWSKPAPLYPDSREVDWPYAALLRHFQLQAFPIESIFTTSPEKVQAAAKVKQILQSKEEEPKVEQSINEKENRLFCIRCGEPFSSADPEAILCSKCCRPEELEKHKPLKNSSSNSRQEKFQGAEWKKGDIILGTYEVKDVLGEGGMGIVYLVHQLKWHIDMAVKCLKMDMLFQKEGKSGFMREAENWISLGFHPQIISCYFVRIIDNALRVFVEYADRGSLAEWIENGTLYEGAKEEVIKRMLDVSIQFAWGLNYAHEQGMIHRDVKPANVMMNSNGTVKLTDFGLSKAADENQASGKTINGMTPAYCSPEQAELMFFGKSKESNRRITEKSDMWSFALSILEMFSGGRTWSAGQAAAYSLKSYLEFGAVTPQIPPMPEKLSLLLEKCFEDDQELRPSAMSEIAEQLMKIYEAETKEPYSRVLSKDVELIADSLNNSAVSYLDLNLEDKALECWDRALREAVFHKESLLNYSYTKWKKAAISSTEFLCSIKVMEKEKRADLNYWRFLIDIYAEMGNYEEIEKICKNFPELKGLDFLSNEEKTEIRLYKVMPDKASGNNQWVHTNSLSCKPEGLNFLSGSSDGIVRLCSTETCSELCKYIHGMDAIVAVHFYDGGRYFVSADEKGLVCLWDANSRRPVKSFNLQPNQKVSLIKSLCISADGKYIAAGNSNGDVIIFNCQEGTELRRIHAHPLRTFAVQFSPDGKQIASGGMDNVIRIWNAYENKEEVQLRLEGEQHYCVNSLSYSPDGRYILSGGNDIRLWDSHTGKELWKKSYGKGLKEVLKICFSPDGRLIAAGTGQELSLLETATGRELRKLEEHSSDIVSLCFSSDGSYLLSGDRDKNILCWNIKYAKNPWKNHAYPMLSKVMDSEQLNSNSEEVKDLLKEAGRLMNDKKYVKAEALLCKAQIIPGYEWNGEVLKLLTECGMKGKAERVFLKRARHFHKLKVDNNYFSLAAFSPEGKTAITTGTAYGNLSSCEETIRLWEVVRGKELKCSSLGQERVSAMGFLPDGRYIYLCTYSGKISLWDAVSLTELKVLKCQGGEIRQASLSGDGRYLAVSETKGGIRVLELSSGEEIRCFKGHNSYSSNLFFLPGDLEIISNCPGEETIKLWSMTERKEKGTLFTGYYTSIALSPDGRYLALADMQQGILLWDLTKMKEVMKMNSCENDEGWEQFYSLEFSPCSSFLVSGSAKSQIDNGWVTLWQIPSGDKVWQHKQKGDRLKNVHFSKDGRYILAANDCVSIYELDWKWKFL